MPSVRIRFELSIGDAQLSPAPPTDLRNRFWSTLARALNRADVGYQAAPEQGELQLRRHFGEQLRSHLLSHFHEPSSTLEGELYFRVATIRYRSILLDVDVFGLGKLAKLVGADEDLLVSVLEQYAPDAFLESVVPDITVGRPDLLERGIVQGSASVIRGRVDTTNSASKRSRLWAAMNASLLVPVLLALLVCYVTFVELHYERARYFDNSKVLLDRYETTIKLLETQLECERRHSEAPAYCCCTGVSTKATRPRPAPCADDRRIVPPDSNQK